ncbi:MAG TPA: type II CRISPR RNA-guided endonuclease Cas9, partial [Bacteroidia bacterium]|nr:type II CRISPR RNA-guided endonuclease Cas9 [Bacteroidia bacterium]
TKLIELNIFPDEKLLKLTPLELWGLRAKAISNKIELKEFGRVLYHLNQKRGYKSSRADANLDKKDTEYVKEVKGRHEEIIDAGLTIGQKFYNELKQNEYYRIKQQVFPREAYIEEFEAICKEQQKYYPKIITNKLIGELRDEVIYYQRKLKSQKGLVSVCEFEGFQTKTKEGKEIFAGPKVAPKSSPLFQVCKIWENINTINLKNKQGESFCIPIEKKVELFDYLDNNEKLSSAKLFEILVLKKNDGWYANKQIEKGIQGNLTKTQILKHLSEPKDLLKFDFTIKEDEKKETYLINKKTGEITETSHFKIVDSDIEQQPLYKLWHTIYSIADVGECANALVNKFGLEQTIAEKLANIDFTKSAFGNKSSKAMRKILPYLMDGYVFSDACSFAGYNHSNSLTKDENAQRKLISVIANLPKNSLRQPIVEKILNQMINLVNAVVEKYGKIDEIRIELARELKQSKDERNETFYNLNKRERENETIRKRISEEYGLRATRNNVIKWRLFHEINNDESKMNASCMYCGKAFGITDSLRGNNIDVEHIIPKSLLFDDSQSNKTLSHRNCNEAKGNKTAYDFMKSKSDEELHQYIERIEQLFKSKIIGKGKRDRLLMTESKIPKDFIERQLRETQYIAKKSKEILEQICNKVWSNSGSVTEYLRRIWGWDDVLMN